MWKKYIEIYNAKVESWVEGLRAKIMAAQPAVVVEEKPHEPSEFEQMADAVEVLNFLRCNRQENSAFLIMSPYSNFPEFVEKLDEVNNFITLGLSIYRKWSPERSKALTLPSLFITSDQKYTDEYACMEKFKASSKAFIRLYEHCISDENNDTSYHNAVVLSGFAGQLRATLSDLIDVQDKLSVLQ